MTPFLEKQETIDGVSCGPTPHGYDVRVGERFQVPIGLKFIKPGHTKITHHDYEGGVIDISAGVTINPNSYIQIETIEKFKMPPDITAIIMNKNTWAQLFIHGPNTIVDAGFEGTLTIAIQNLGPWPVSIGRGMGIAHLIFHRSKKALNPYKGKYQHQVDPTGAIF